MRYRSLASSLVSLPLLGSLALLSAAVGCGGCGDDTTTPQGGGGGGTPTLRPGDICTTPQPNFVRVRFSPAQIFVPACTGGDCTTRHVRVIGEPDFCGDTPITFTSSDENALPTPSPGNVTLYQSETSLDIGGISTPGTYTLTASIAKGDGTDATASLEVVVLDSDLPTCSGTASDDSLTAGETLTGTAGLAGASIGLPDGANDPNSGSYLWSVAPFATTLGCASMDLPAGHIALGPAVSFGPADLQFQREIPMSVPINPALMPPKARLRHLRVLYSGPEFREPRVVPVADPRIEKIGGEWALSFKAPRLGTYQAIVKSDAGTRKYTRHLTHRAVIGVSMGGMGTSMFGTRHHDKFDVLVPLGGPATWSWLMHYIQQNHLGGFRPIAPGTQLADIQLTPTPCDAPADCKTDETCVGKTVDHSGKCTLLPKPVDPYEHTQAFNAWWAEYPRSGTGGRFPRDEYCQIFRDLALLFGNPNGDNNSPGGEFLPPGVPPTDKSVLGDHPGNECAVWVDPIGGAPDEDKQREIAQNCPAERCAHTLTLNNYYDDEFNPDGTFPVITVCDGTPAHEDETPWANAWKPEGPNNYPLEVGLAVDYNGNGVRDELEPIIKSGYEPWQDTGPDGVASPDEPGYQPGVDEDPEGDDYQAQYNPGGTENDYRFEDGEPYEDVGMDGVAGTPQQPANGYAQPGDGYDVGEGDGKFTASRGLKRMWDFDPAAVIRRQSVPPGGEMDDDALDRIDLWTDGGLRDIFNFHVAAQHLAGSMASRGRDTAYYTSFANMPGFDPTKPNTFTPGLVPWEDVPGSVLMRYGLIDPTPEAIENGSGQHVGTLNEIAFRLQTALYYIGSRWPEPELRSVVKYSGDDPSPDLPLCEADGACTFDFTDSTGRTGPVTVNLPPGYAHKEQLDRRYPVIYMLHGYGQTPEDLGAAIIFVANWMNNPGDSMSSRMPKAILVYVDGRCRTDENGKAECIRGNFFTDSGRDDGMKAESWWLELMDYVDGRFRTMPPSDVEWEE
ncbi:MAG: hypothetical protein U0271_38675 [Polyangiaceae bacterium]